MNKVTIFKRSISAGVLIGIGTVAKLSCSNQVIGSILFSIGLFFICSCGMYLFTGKIAYINKKNWSEYPIIWFGNLMGCILSMMLIRIAKPNIHEIANEIMLSKVNNNILSVSILAFFCGVIMYLAVDNYRTSDSDISKIFGIIIGVTVFLLCGFEHSIANMAYATLAIQSTNEIVKNVEFIVIVSAFNTVGSLSSKVLLTPQKWRKR